MTHISTISWRTRGERGEGVISTAIAVLIVALLGVVLWTGFSTIMHSATDKTQQQVDQIGQ
jgi:hypothetical protein